MPSPNSSFDELASLTIANYSDDLRDNVSNNIPFYAFMDGENAIVEEEGGTTLLENLDYGDNATFRWFSGYDELSTAPTDAFTSANFDWKECNANIVFNRREIAINSGSRAQHKLIKSKSNNAERTLRNNIGAALYYVGTEFDGKALGGLRYLVADDPTTGIVGGINRATATNDWWRNQVFDESVDSIVLSASTIQDAMELLWVRCTRSMDTPKLWVYGNTYWRFWAGSVNVNQQYIQDGTAKKTGHASFPYYMFKTAKVFHDPNCAATRGYAVNSDYLKIKVHKDRNMTPDKPRYPAGQAATVIPVDFMGNVVCGNASLQGVMQP